MKKQLSLIFAVMFLVSLTITSCSKGSVDGDAKVTETETSIQTETETSVEEIKPDLPERNFEAYEFKFIDKGKEHNSHWCAKDIYAPEMNGDALNDAVFTRNSTIEEKYNIKILEKGAKDPLGESKKAIMSGDDLYDVVNIGLNTGIENLQSSGYLLNLFEIPYLDLEKPWWDARSVEDLSIEHKLYGVTGDIIVMDKDATWAMLFSKDVIKNYKLDDIYTLVNENKWTYDVFSQMVDAVSGDLNGDGVMGVEDSYGHLGETFNTFALISGFGDKIISKDNNDLPYVTMMEEETVNHFEKVVTLIGDKSKSLLSANVAGYADVWEEVFHPAFGDGHILFYITGLNRVSLLRNQEADFGIVPMPKWDESQERYYNVVSLWASSGISVPMTCKNPERTGIILEALCAESTDTLRPAYYDITLKGKGTRDVDSEASLDTIFNSRVYELGVQYNWGGIFDVWSNLTVKNSVDVSSAYAKIETKVQDAIKKTIDTMNEKK